MIFKKFDFLSPHINLYYKGHNTHNSIFSGILTIMAYIIIFIFSVYYSQDFFKKRSPIAYFYNRYVDDIGNYPLNATSMFHFIQLISSGSENIPKEADLSSITIFGYEESIDIIMDVNDPMQFNHWVYGKCNNDSDTKGIPHLINNILYEEALCIRKYYNKEKDTYYKTNDENFRWPNIDKGCSHPDRTFYGVIMEKCKNNTARKKAGFEDCKSPKEIDDYIVKTSVILQLIDFNADVLNYKNPFTKYFYSLTNGLFKDSLTVNHLNFNPAQMKTHNGILFDNVVIENAHFFEQNEKVTMDPLNSGMIVGWYFWMINTMQYYERKYKRIQDILGEIGGLSSIVLLISNGINLIVWKFNIYLDTKQLIDRTIEIKEKEYKKRIINFKNENKDFYPPIGKNNCNLIKKENYMQNHFEKTINFQALLNDGVDMLHQNFFIKNEKNTSNQSFINKGNILDICSQQRYYINNNKIMDNKEYFTSNTRNIFNEDKPGKNNKNKTFENNYINTGREIKNNIYIRNNSNNFINYLKYLLCCKKNNFDISYYENIRFKIISEENIFQNYFDICNLIRYLRIERLKSNL